MFTVKSIRINMDVALRSVILLGFALFFYLIIQTDKVQLYVNPRIVPYVKFGIVAMVMISLFSIRDLFKPKRKANLAPYLFFLIPLLMAFALPPKAMDSTSMAFGDVNITQQQSSNADYLTPDDIAESSTGDTAQRSDDSSATGVDTQSSSNSLDSIQADPGQTESRLIMQGDTIVIGDNDFIQWLQEIYDNMGKYDGKKIQVVGFVFKSKELKENEFAPTRFMMACCTADLQPVGFLCRYDKASELKQDTWLKITGTIKVVDYKGEKTPVIIAEKVASVNKPKNEYVYPY